MEDTRNLTLHQVMQPQKTAGHFDLHQIVCIIATQHWQPQPGFSEYLSDCFGSKAAVGERLLSAKSGLSMNCRQLAGKN